MSELAANIVGTGAAICSITSFAPQVIKIARDRDATNVSLRTYVLTCTCFILWTIYGVMTDSWPITIANTLAGLMAFSVLFMKWKFREGDPRRTQSARGSG